MIKEWQYYFFYFKFRFKEPFTDFKATGVLYFLYCFFIWILSHVWLKFKITNSPFSYDQVFLYIGVTESLFMSFISTRQINDSTEDFALYLVRPRSWLGREFVANIANCLGKRILFLLTLITFAFLAQIKVDNYFHFILRTSLIIILLSIPKAFVSMLFSALKLNFAQTEYFILPFSKLFLSLGGVFGPLSDYGEPWRSLLLKLPGSDLFFQPAYYCIHGEFYQLTTAEWLTRLTIIILTLYVLTLYFYKRGRAFYQAWGG